MWLKTIVPRNKKFQSINRPNEIGRAIVGKQMAWVSSSSNLYQFLVHMLSEVYPDPSMAIGFSAANDIIIEGDMRQYFYACAAVFCNKKPFFVSTHRKVDAALSNAMRKLNLERGLVA